MKARLLPFLFPLLFTTAVVVAGVAYHSKLGTTQDSYGHLQQALKGLNPFLQKGSRICVTDHSGEALFRSQLQIFLPFNHIAWQDSVNIGNDSLVTIQKAQSSPIDTVRLRNTHRMVWHRSGSDYTVHLWCKLR